MWNPLANYYVGKRFCEYTIVKRMGHGRYGVCYLASTDVGHQVIIKKFRPHMLRKNAEKSVNEAVILSQLEDERIPQLLGVINERKLYGYVLTYMKGSTIKDMLFQDYHQFTKNEIYSIGIKLISIIEVLHQKGIVHRDIRIPNVIIHEEEVYLIDFGLARWQDNEKYPLDVDFSYFGDLILYLLYSTYKKENAKSSPWYIELDLSEQQRSFLKRLLGIDLPYQDISQVRLDFQKSFNGSE